MSKPQKVTIDQKTGTISGRVIRVTQEDVKKKEAKGEEQHGGEK